MVMVMTIANEVFEVFDNRHDSGGSEVLSATKQLS